MLEQHISQFKLQQQVLTVSTAITAASARSTTTPTRSTTTPTATAQTTRPKNLKSLTEQQETGKSKLIHEPSPKIENSPTFCLDPPFQYGHCSEPIVAWSFDINGHIECRNFTYSGCGLSTNIFWTVEDCTSKCRGITVNKEVQSFPSMQQSNSSEEEEDNDGGEVATKNRHVHIYLMGQQNPFMQSFQRRKNLFLTKNLSKKSTGIFVHHYHN